MSSEPKKIFPPEIQCRFHEHPIGETAAWVVEQSDWPSAFRQLCEVIAIENIKAHWIESPNKKLKSLFLTSSAGMPKPPAHCWACRLEHDQVYLPNHARLLPEPLFEDYMSILIATPVLIHPSWGWIHLNKDFELNGYELLNTPSVLNPSWKSLNPGFTNRPKLKRFELIIPETMTFMEDQDISNKDPSDIFKDNPDQKQKSNLNLGKGLGLPIAYGAKFILSLLPEDRNPSSEANWAGKMMEWAESFINNNRDKTESLLDMLDKNPDLGLQYAISLDPNSSERDGYQSNGNLNRQSMDFSINEATSSGPYSRWDMDYDHQYRLREKYQELARREIALGRYRKAATIYSRLLGEHRLAAETLANGGDYREAAILYEKRCDLLDEAAECWIKHGEYEKAIELYKKLDKEDEIARLYMKLGETDKAMEIWNEKIDEKLIQGQHFDAALIAKDECDDFDRYLFLLGQAWPESKQRIPCLKEWINEMHQLDNHKEINQVLQEQFEDIEEKHSFEWLNCVTGHKVFVDNVGIKNHLYPLVLERISEQCFSNDTKAPRKNEYLNYLKSFRGQDQILRRDLQRGSFEDIQKTKKPNVISGTGRWELNLIKKINIADEKIYHGEIIGYNLITLSYHRVQGWFLRCCSVDGKYKNIQKISAWPKTNLQVSVCKSNGDSLTVVFPGVGRNRFPAQTISFATQDIHINTLTCDGQASLGVCINDHREYKILSYDNGLYKIETRNESGEKKNWDELDKSMLQPSFACHRDKLYYCLDKKVSMLKHHDKSETNFSFQIKKLLRTPSSTSPRIIAVGYTSVGLVWPEKNWESPEVILDYLDDPQCTLFSMSKCLIMDSKGQFKLLSLNWEVELLEIDSDIEFAPGSKLFGSSEYGKFVFIHDESHIYLMECKEV